MSRFYSRKTAVVPYVQHFVGPEQQTVPFEEVLSTSSGRQTHVPLSIHSILLVQQAHFSTFSSLTGDFVVSLEEEMATGGTEHVWEQFPLQLSDAVTLLEEEMATGGAEHVWEQFPLQLSDAATFLKEETATGAVEHVLQQPPLKSLSRAHEIISHPS
jgi:hypothetical protein